MFGLEELYFILSRQHENSNDQFNSCFCTIVSLEIDKRPIDKTFDPEQIKLNKVLGNIKTRLRKKFHVRFQMMSRGYISQKSGLRRLKNASTSGLIQGN